MMNEERKQSNFTGKIKVEDIEKPSNYVTLDKVRKYMIALREPNGDLAGYWNGTDRNFSKFLPWEYTLKSAKSICTKTIYPMLSDSPFEKYQNVSIEEID